MSGATFRVMTDGELFVLRVEVDETTARRAAAMSARGDDTLAQVVADAVNLHAMAGLIAAALPVPVAGRDEQGGGDA